MVIESPSTKKCPSCAEEIRAEALVCRFCGTRFEVIHQGYCTSCHRQVAVTNGLVCPACGTALIDEHWESRPILPAAAVGVPPPPPPAVPRPEVPVGEVREGFTASIRMKVGEIVAGLALAAMLLTSIVAFAGPEALAWAERRTGLLLELGYPAPGYIAGTVVLGIVLGIAARPLSPRARDVGAATKRRYLRTVRREQGIAGLYVRRGMKGALVASWILWIGMAGIVAFNLSQIGDTAWEPRFGIYLAALLVGAGFIGTLLMWPAGTTTVLMDRRGGLHRPGELHREL